MQILARAVGRRKEAVAQIQITKGTGQFIINNKPAQDYLQNNSCSLIAVKSPFLLCELISSGVASQPLGSLESLPANEKELETNKKTSSFFDASKSLQFSFEQVDTIVKVKGGGLIGQTEAIKLGVARAICNINDFNLLKLQTNSETEPSLDNTPSTSSEDVKTERDSQIEANLPENANTGIAVDSSLSTLSIGESAEEHNLEIENLFKKQLKTKGYLTQDSRIKERRKYGLKKARKASQYHKR